MTPGNAQGVIKRGYNPREFDLAENPMIVLQFIVRQRNLIMKTFVARYCRRFFVSKLDLESVTTKDSVKLFIIQQAVAFIVSSKMSQRDAVS